MICVAIGVAAVQAAFDLMGAHSVEWLVAVLACMRGDNAVGACVTGTTSTVRAMPPDVTPPQPQPRTPAADAAAATAMKSVTVPVTVAVEVSATVPVTVAAAEAGAAGG